MSFRRFGDMFKRKAGANPGKEEFEKKYILKEKLGSGQFAEVFLGLLKENEKEQFAVKVIKKSKLLTEEDRQGLEQEVQILQDIDHHGIIKLYDVFEGSTEWYLVTELARGGELFDRIVEKTKDGAYSEKEAALVVMQIAESLKFCHDKKIVHRDLKPENLLLQDDGEDAKVKLADFGFASYCEKGLTDGCGTLVYVAPEILRGHAYHTSPDMWSLGVITFILLCGYPPFFHTSQEELSKKICRGRYRFRPEDWDRVSFEAKEFIRGLLKRSPEMRMTADDVFKSPWITNYSKLSKTGLDINKNLKTFQAQMLMKKAFFALKAFGKLQALLKDYKEEDHVVEKEDVEGA